MLKLIPTRQSWIFYGIFSVCIFIAALYLPYRLFDIDEIDHLAQLEKQVNEIQLVIDRVILKNRMYLHEIKQLRDHHQAVLKIARTELGMIRNDEVIFWIGENNTEKIKP